MHNWIRSRVIEIACGLSLVALIWLVLFGVLKFGWDVALAATLFILLALVA